MNECKGTGEKVTSKYNELRTKEYAHLRQRFYDKYPKSLESDTNFEDDIFFQMGCDCHEAKFKALQAENKLLKKAINNAIKDYHDGMISLGGLVGMLEEAVEE